MQSQCHFLTLPEREDPLCCPMTLEECFFLVNVRHQEADQLVSLCDGQAVGHLLVHQQIPEPEFPLLQAPDTPLLVLL